VSGGIASDIAAGPRPDDAGLLFSAPYVWYRKPNTKKEPSIRRAFGIARAALYEKPFFFAKGEKGSRHSYPEKPYKKKPSVRDARKGFF
jgi:hypothetical protein